MTAPDPQTYLVAPKPDTGRDPLDRYYTPDRLAHAITRVFLRELGNPQGLTWLEPSAGTGAFCRAVRSLDCAAHLTAVDVDEDAPVWRCDDSVPDVSVVSSFLHTGFHGRFDVVIGNPPYRDAEAHIRHALRATRRHVVFLLRQSILGSIQRGPLWSDHPMRALWTLVPRPSFTNGGTDASEYSVIWWDRLRGDRQWSRLAWNCGEPGIDQPMFGGLS